MPATVESRWIMGVGRVPNARMRLFCFPSAGGGASMYRLWITEAPRGVEVCPVQLPGRENRLAEPRFSDVEPLLDPLAQAIRPYMDMPFALFGHSMGGLISFELTRRLRDEYGLSPARLFVSAFRAAHLPDPDPPIHNLPDPQFLAEVGRLNGTPHEVLHHPELMAMLLPLLRADLTLCETYSYSPGKPLTCPISVFGGLEDPEASCAEMDAWRHQTTAAFRMRMMAGDHFFLVGSRGLVLQAIGEDLADVKGPTGA
jgi:medium-chain acyl-[acyl-carrier-protein] hydrolase